MEATFTESTGVAIGVKLGVDAFPRAGSGNTGGSGLIRSASIMNIDDYRCTYGK